MTCNYFNKKKTHDLHLGHASFLFEEISALYGTFDHSFHDLLLSDEEDDDHRNDGQESCGKDSVPALYVGAYELLDGDGDSHNLTVLSKHH